MDVMNSCNNFDDQCGRIFVPNKKKEVNLSVFNMKTRINESKTLAKHVSWKSKFHARKCNSNRKWNKEL